MEINATDLPAFVCCALDATKIACYQLYANVGARKVSFTVKNGGGQR